MKRLFKIIRNIVIVLILLVLICFAIYKVRVAQSGNFNILIIGIDARENEEVSRSDSLMVAHIDENHKEITLTSVPRDSYVYIPSENREDKITHAYAYNGKQGTIETMNYLFETEFEYYIEVDFEKMIQLVDSIGGIDLTPTATFCEMNEQDVEGSFCFEEGVTQHMNGEMALAYSRHRKSDNDFKRAERQQEVIKTMIGKVKSSNVFEIYKFYQDVKSISDTNLDLWTLIGYSDMVFHDFTLSQEIAEGSDAYIYDEYYGQDLYYYLLNEEWVQTKVNNLQK